MTWRKKRPAMPPIPPPAGPAGLLPEPAPSASALVPDEIQAAHQDAKVAKARALQQRRRLAVMGARLVELHEKNGFGESLERVYKGEA